MMRKNSTTQSNDSPELLPQTIDNKKTRVAKLGVLTIENLSSQPGDFRRYVAWNSELQFFTDDKFQAGRSHAEYAQYWRDNSSRIPTIALRLSGGMLPAELFANTNDPVELHDACIQTAVTNENEIVLKLHGDDNGGLRKIEIRYDRTGLAACLYIPLFYRWYRIEHTAASQMNS